MHSAHTRKGDSAHTRKGRQLERKERCKKRRRVRRMWILFVVCVGFALFVWALFATNTGKRFMYSGAPWLFDFAETSRDAGKVLFFVRPGDTGESVAARLEKAGVIKSVYGFLRTMQDHKHLQLLPGNFELPKQGRASDVLEILSSAGNKKHSVIVKEGQTHREIFLEVEQKVGVLRSALEREFQKPAEYGLPAAAINLEGFLWPGVYDFERGKASARDVLRAMTNRALAGMKDMGAKETDIWNLVRMASVVEKEVHRDEDLGKAARVFYNRLNRDMLLQSDATVTYFTGENKTVETTPKQRADDKNPYNTYVHRGLPIGPISNPGRRAIQAAINPADGDWLYFVSINQKTGETLFSSTYEEHLRAVERWKAAE